MLDLKRHGQPQDNHGSWKKKTLDRVEQAEPQAGHIIIMVIAVFTYIGCIECTHASRYKNNQLPLNSAK